MNCMKLEKVRGDLFSLAILVIMLLVLTCVPASINTQYSFTLENVQFRFNIIFTFISALILVLVRFRKSISAIEVSFYIFIVIQIFIAMLIIFTNNEYNFVTVFEAGLVLWLPFFLIQRVIRLSQDFIKIFYNVTLIVGCFIGAQTVFYSLFFNIMEWQGSANYVRDNTTLGSSTTSSGFCFTILVLAYLAYKEWKSKKYLVIAMSMILTIFVMQSRSSILLVLAFFCIEFIRSNVAHKFKIALSIIFVVIIAVNLFPDLLLEIFARFFTNQSIDSNQARKEFAKEGLERFYNFPLVGTGLGLAIKRLSWVPPHYNNWITNTHNQWIALLAETGVVGTVMFMDTISKILRKARRENSIFMSIFAFLEFAIVGFMFEMYISSDIRSGLALWLLLLPMKKFSNCKEIKNDYN